MNGDRSPTVRPRRLLAGVFVVALAAVAAVGLTRDRPAPLGTILVQEHDGLRFVFHVPTGHGSLYDLRTDPGCLQNIAAQRPDDMNRLRNALTNRLGVPSLDELRSPREEADHEAMRGLGYL